MGPSGSLGVVLTNAKRVYLVRLFRFPCGKPLAFPELDFR